MIVTDICQYIMCPIWWALAALDTAVRLLQYSSIGSNNGLAPGWHQAIISTKDDYFTDAYDLIFCRGSFY